jgi:hypothetical protein
MRIRSLILTVVMLCSFSAAADPIEYKFVGVGSGSIGGTAFASSAFEFTGLSDTIAVFQNQFGFPLIQGPLFRGARLSIEGIGTADFLNLPGLTVFNNTQEQFVAFRRFGPNSQPNFLTLIAGGQGLDLWDHTVSIGPLSGIGVPGREVVGGIQDTTLGPVFFSSIQSLQFQATVTPIPLPSAVGLFIAALGVVGILPRRFSRRP